MFGLNSRLNFTHTTLHKTRFRRDQRNNLLKMNQEVLVAVSSKPQMFIFRLLFEGWRSNGYVING